jgi:hypothetical protein|nr:MAG TPA: HATPase [Bacteriophage sp.]
MIIETENKTETTAENKYNIEVTSKTFRSLFGDLYANPFRSMIREIVANAHDANRQSGYNGPVEISIHKDGVEYYIEIKDHGVGMTYDDMVNIYTTFFKSTKNDSNDSIGGFGIGSKSPLAYADYFIATSVKDSKKNVIMTSKNNDIPSYQVMLENVDTDDANGTTIRIPIEQNDVGKIEPVCYEELIGFWPLPKLTDLNGEDVSAKAIEVVDGLRLIKSKTNRSPRFRMSVGGPNYVISHLHIAFNTIFIMDVPIKDVKVSLSRETVTYDDALRQTLSRIFKEKINEIDSKVKAMTREEILSTPWIYKLLLTSDTRPIFETIFDKFNFGFLKGVKWAFSNQTYGGKYCSRVWNDTKKYMVGHLIEIIKEESLNFAPTSMVDDGAITVSKGCMPPGVTFFIDMPEKELKEFAESIGKKCNILTPDDPKIRKYLNRKNREPIPVKKGDPIKFSADVFYSSNNSNKIVYELDEIGENDIFIVGDPNTKSVHYVRKMEALKKIFPDRNIYIGRGTPKGFIAAKVSNLKNVFTFYSSDPHEIHYVKLFKVMTDEEKEKAIAAAKFVMRKNPGKTIFNFSSTIGSESICPGSFIYTISPLLKERMKDIVLSVINNGDSIDLGDNSHPLIVIGATLIKMEIEKVLDQMYPMWNDPNSVFLKYIESLDNELQRNSQS